MRKHTWEGASLLGSYSTPVSSADDEMWHRKVGVFVLSPSARNSLPIRPLVQHREGPYFHEDGEG